ncbi:MAG TPA: glycosyltransferase [Thermoanaerobaculia bacterium]|nr:glycosyltransferase [Thermoanaerobaculia bacterium]
MQRTFIISSMAGGGAARTTANLANHRAACGEAVEILTLHQPHARDVYPLHPSIVRRDLGDARPRSDSTSAVLRLLARLKAPAPVVLHAPLMARLRDALRGRDCTAIGVGDLTNVRLLIAAHGLPLRVIASEMADPEGYSIGAWERVRLHMYRHADAVVCLTEEHADFFRGQGLERVHAIPNPVLPAPPRNGARRERLVLSLTRLSWEKDLGLLIRAFGEVAPRHPEWRLEIWGTGPARRELESLVAALQLQDRARLPGMTLDVYEPLARAELFAMTSRTEGIPNALCEAMAAGVAPVVIDCSAGMRAVIRDGIDGVLVRRRDAFASALDTLMRDDGRRGRLAARAPEVTTRFAPERIAARWDGILESGKVVHAC